MIGRKLGPYDILAKLGEGGMGEVYKAHDTRLGRDVAIKVLPSALAADTQALARFEREARAVAALSHPNIIALFDIGKDDIVFMVTELLEGQTLRDRLNAGPVPPRKAVEYAVQIAAGLAAAHDRGVVHRDLKPENVFVTNEGRIKLLDFGVAQVSPPIDSGAGSIAVTTMQTTPGMVLGTLGYMAPEQLRGQAIDARVDVFALGTILYEMLTGRRAFAGETPADSISAILHRDPPELTRADSGASPQMARLVQRCLEKTPAERFQSARDLLFAIEAIGTGESAERPAASTTARRRVVRAVAAAAMAAAALAGVFLAGRRSSPSIADAPPVRFSIPTTAGWFDAASVSPDGRYIVYTGGTAGQGTSGFTGVSGYAPGRFWLRRTDSIDAVPLSETETATPLFFWSPDSRSLGYVTGDALIVRELPDGAPRKVADVPGRSFGAAWTSRDEIIVSTGDVLSRVSARGGPLQPVLRTDPSRERWRGWPSALPGGDRFVYTALLGPGDEGRLETRAASIDGRELGTIATGMVGALYTDGHLLFGLNGGLYAQPFDVARLRTNGAPVPVAASVAQDWRSGLLAARASETGVLAFRDAAGRTFQFTWVDRGGHATGTVGAADNFTSFDLSPDGKRIIVTRNDPKTNRDSLWMIDAERGVTSLVSDKSDAEDADDPTWTPDGSRVAFRHGSKIVLRSPYGGEERTVVEAEAYPDSFTRDGRYVVFGRARGNLYEQFALDVLTPGARPIPIVTDVTLSDESRFSPNGKWVAYHSNQTGGTQIHVVPFPPTGENWQISTAGGAQPRWSVDGQELFYLDGSGQLISVKMPDSDPRKASQPVPLFQTGLAVSDALDQFAVARDRFLIRMPTSRDSNTTAIQVIVNWKSALTRPRE